MNDYNDGDELVPSIIPNHDDRTDRHEWDYIKYRDSINGYVKLPDHSMPEYVKDQLLEVFNSLVLSKKSNHHGQQAHGQAKRAKLRKERKARNKRK